MEEGHNQQEQPQKEQQVQITSDEKTMALLAHLLGIVLGFIGPLIIWLLKKDESKFVDYHGKEALNFQLTMLIGYIIGYVLTFVLIGICILGIVWIVAIIFSVIAAVAANNGEYYRYPISIKFIS